MWCSSCGAENSPANNHCGSCGQALAGYCSNCSVLLFPGSRFCSACGEPVVSTGASGTAGRGPGTGARELRPITVLFADVVGFSTFAEGMDPEELQSLLTETFIQLAREITSRAGRVEKYIGDAVVATFGTPVAREDDSARAVEAGLRMFDVVRARTEATGISLRLRIGVNRGLVVTGGAGDGNQDGVVGEAVIVAARLQQTAEPGELLISDSVWPLVRDHFDAQHVGLVEVKGRIKAVDVYRIVGPLQFPGRRQTPFVGRQEELRLIELLWSNTGKGNTHVVSVVGEPGVGKSRLLAELPLREDALDIRVRCDSDRAFGPFLDLFEAILQGLPSSVDDLTRRTTALGIEPDLAILLGILFGLADASPMVALADEQQKRQVFSAVWQFLMSLLRDTKALIVFDDVHWADRSSLELLGFLLERLGGVPLTVILAYRPGFERVERTTLRAGHTLVRLDLLAREESIALARGYLGVASIPSDLEQVVATRAEGNAFFIEELLQALIELGSLSVTDGEVILAKVGAQIPDTVEGMILARIDRLPSSARSLLQLAAVVGRRFTTDLLQAMTPDVDIASSLDVLTNAQLVVPVGPGEWSFRHAMTQEVSYGTLLRRQRREYHRIAASAIERLFAGDPGSLELLAEHYAKAEDREKARRFALEAGDAAAERTGFAEARSLYERALALWGEGDERGRAEVLMKLGWAALLTADPALARTALIEAEDAWRTAGDTHQAALALAMLGRSHFFAGESDQSAELLQRAMDLLEPEGASPELVQAHIWRSILDQVAGSIKEGRVLAAKGLAMAEELDLLPARAALEISMGSFDTRDGDPAGITQLERGLSLAVEANDVESIGRAYLHLAIAFADLGRSPDGILLCEEGRRRLRKLGALSFEWVVASKEAEMLAEMGRYEDALELSDEALGTQRAVLIRPAVVWAAGARVNSLLRRGRYQEAREQLDEILPIARLIGGSMFHPVPLLLEAELQETIGNRAAARQAVTEAFDAVISTTSTADLYRVAVPVARLLPERLSELLDKAGRRTTNPAFRAPLLEAEGIAAGDSSRLRAAADLYAALGLPYQEARCRLASGDSQRASELIQRFHLGQGPLGAHTPAPAM